MASLPSLGRSLPPKEACRPSALPERHAPEDKSHSWQIDWPTVTPGDNPARYYPHSNMRLSSIWQISNLSTKINYLTIMKLFYKTILSTTVICLLSLLGLVSKASAVQKDNLLSNSDVSIIDDNGNPQNYNTDSWGNNSATFSYITADGYHALKVVMDQYVDGDAKWYHDSISVEENNTYTYHDLYRSSVTTHYWAQFTDNSNNVTYQWLGQAPASETWQSNSVNFTPPQNTKSVSIFHIINSNGYLDTTQFSLYNNSDPGETNSDNLINGDFEQNYGETTIPFGWTQAVYGDITAQYSINNSTVHSGSHSASINITAAPDGEAGLVSNTINSSENQKTNISFWYHSNVYLYAYIEITTTSGTEYKSLTSVPSGNNQWSQYTDSFITPSNTTAIRLHIATSDIGIINIDDVTLSTTNTVGNNQFNFPIISINFDDGLLGSYQYGTPVLSSLGLTGTYYLNASTINTSSHISTQQIKNLANTGNEIGSHGYYHIDQTTLSKSDLSQQIQLNKSKLSGISGQSINSFAVPFGVYNDTVISTVATYHTNLRDTSGALNYKYNFNPFKIHAKVVTANTTTNEINNLIQETKNNNAWLVLVFHNISKQNSNDEYTLTTKTLTNFLNLVTKSGIKVMTNKEALSTITSQL